MTPTEMREVAAKVTRELTAKFGNPNGTDYEQGAQDHGHRIFHAILKIPIPASPSRSDSGEDALVEALAKALEPFAKECARQERVRSYRDGDCLVADCRNTIGELRRASAAFYAKRAARKEQA